MWCRCLRPASVEEAREGCYRAIGGNRPSTRTARESNAQKRAERQAAKHSNVALGNAGGASARHLSQLTHNTHLYDDLPSEPLTLHAASKCI